MFHPSGPCCYLANTQNILDAQGLEINSAGTQNFSVLSSHNMPTSVTLKSSLYFGKDAAGSLKCANLFTFWNRRGKDPT